MNTKFPYFVGDPFKVGQAAVKHTAMDNETLFFLPMLCGP